MAMKIILLVGASGAGKDTLLRHARSNFAAHSGLLFPRRYITRIPDGAEDNFFLDEQAFSLLAEAGFFISCWHAHGNRYGIARHSLLREKGAALCSVSRTVIADFERQFDEVITIQIRASEAALRSRLTGRGRENDEEIGRRLARAAVRVQARRLIEFDNSTDLETSRAAFTSCLHNLIRES